MGVLNGMCGSDLQVLWMHGERGQGLAQFYIPHSVAVDTCQRVGLFYSNLQSSSNIQEI